MIGNVIFAMHTTVVGKLARRGNTSTESILLDIVNLVKDKFKSITVSNAYKALDSYIQNDYFVVCYKGGDGRYWLGAWSANTLINNCGETKKVAIFDMDEATTRIDNHFNNNTNNKDNGDTNKLRKERTNREQGNESRGLAIKDTRRRVAVTSGQVSYKAINV